MSAEPRAAAQPPAGLLWGRRRQIGNIYRPFVFSGRDGLILRPAKYRLDLDQSYEDVLGFSGTISWAVQAASLPSSWPKRRARGTRIRA